MSKVWFGIIHSSSIDNNEDLYDNLIFTPSNYSLIGKLKNGGQLTIIKVLFYFESVTSLRDFDYLSLKLDENLGFISVKDTIFKNSILSRKWTTSINKMYIRDSIFLKELPKNEFFIGGIVGYGNSVPYIGPSLLFKNKKEDIYNLNIGLDLNKNLLYQVGFAKKIKLRK